MGPELRHEVHTLVQFPQCVIAFVLLRLGLLEHTYFSSGSVMPRTSGEDLWADPSKQHETQRGMVARGRLMPKKRKINNSRMGKPRKTKTDESQVAVLDIASRGSWEGCRLCWGPGCAAGRDEMRADERGRRTAEGYRGLEAGNWRIAGSRERGLSGAGRALGIQGGNVERDKEKEKWSEKRINDKLGLSSKGK